MKREIIKSVFGMVAILLMINMALMQPVYAKEEEERLFNITKQIRSVGTLVKIKLSTEYDDIVVVVRPDRIDNNKVHDYDSVMDDVYFIYIAHAISIETKDITTEEVTRITFKPQVGDITNQYIVNNHIETKSQYGFLQYKMAHFKQRDINRGENTEEDYPAIILESDERADSYEEYDFTTEYEKTELIPNPNPNALTNNGTPVNFVIDKRIIQNKNVNTILKNKYNLNSEESRAPQGKHMLLKRNNIKLPNSGGNKISTSNIIPTHRWGMPSNYATFGKSMENYYNITYQGLNETYSNTDKNDYAVWLELLPKVASSTMIYNEIPIYYEEKYELTKKTISSGMFIIPISYEVNTFTHLLTTIKYGEVELEDKGGIYFYTYTYTENNAKFYGMLENEISFFIPYKFGRIVDYNIDMRTYSIIQSHIYLSPSYYREYASSKPSFIQMFYGEKQKYPYSSALLNAILFNQIFEPLFVNINTILITYVPYFKLIFALTSLVSSSNAMEYLPYYLTHGKIEIEHRKITIRMNRLIGLGSRK